MDGKILSVFYKFESVEKLYIFFPLTYNSRRYYERQSEVKGTFSKVGEMTGNKTLTRNISAKERFPLLH